MGAIGTVSGYLGTKKVIFDQESNLGPLGSTPGPIGRSRTAYVFNFMLLWQTAGRGGCGCLSTPRRELSQLASLAWGGSGGNRLFSKFPPNPGENTSLMASVGSGTLVLWCSNKYTKS